MKRFSKAVVVAGLMCAQLALQVTAQTLPNQPARPSISITPAMRAANMLKVLPDGRLRLQVTPAFGANECLPRTPASEPCAYLIDASAPAAPRMHAPVDPSNPWWNEVKHNYPSPASGITDCAQVTDQKCVTMSDTSVQTAWKTAWAACGAACTIVVKPGVYQVGYYDVPYITYRKNVRVIGVSDASGQKPIIRGLYTLLKNSTASAYPATLLGWRTTNNDITLENVAFENCGECLNGGSRTLKQVWRLINVDARWCRSHCILIGWEEAGKEDDEIYIHGGEYAYGGNAHTMYLDRTLYQEVIGATIHSPGSQHAIKGIGITLNLIGNVFSSVKPDGTAQPSPGLAAKVNLKDYSGSAVLSLVACQRGLIAFNTIVWRYDGGLSSGIPAIRQPRKAIGGCDIPVDANDPALWASVRAQGLLYPENLTNRLAFPTYWYANRFVLVAKDGTAADANFYVKKIGGAYAVRNQSTYPVGFNPLDAGDWKPYPLTPPEGWAERAYDFVVGNCLENFLPTNALSDLLTVTMVNPDGTPVRPGLRQWTVGDNTCDRRAPQPAWVPHKLPIMTRADYMAGM